METEYKASSTGIKKRSLRIVGKRDRECFFKTSRLKVAGAYVSKPARKPFLYLRPEVMTLKFRSIFTFPTLLNLVVKSMSSKISKLALKPAICSKADFLTEKLQPGRLNLPNIL